MVVISIAVFDLLDLPRRCWRYCRLVLYKNGCVGQQTQGRQSWCKFNYEFAPIGLPIVFAVPHTGIDTYSGMGFVQADCAVSYGHYCFDVFNYCCVAIFAGHARVHRAGM